MVLNVSGRMLALAEIRKWGSFKVRLLPMCPG